LTSTGSATSIFGTRVSNNKKRQLLCDEVASFILFVLIEWENLAKGLVMIDDSHIQPFGYAQGRLRHGEQFCNLVIG